MIAWVAPKGAPIQRTPDSQCILPSVGLPAQVVRPMLRIAFQSISSFHPATCNQTSPYLHSMLCSVAASSFALAVAADAGLRELVRRHAQLYKTLHWSTIRFTLLTRRRKGSRDILPRLPMSPSTSSLITIGGYLEISRKWSLQE